MTTDQVDARRVLATSLVTAVDHVGIAVADLDAAIDVVPRPPRHDPGARGSQRGSGHPRGDAVGARRAGGSAQIQLMAPIDESSAIAKFLDKRGPGIQQLACRVSDLGRPVRAAARAGRAADLRRSPARHGELADQLHPSQGRRRRSDRVGRTGAELRSSRPLSGWTASGAVASSTACASAADPRLRPPLNRSAIPPHALCRSEFHDRSPGSDRS